MLLFFFSSRRRHTRYWRDWSSDVCSSDLENIIQRQLQLGVGADRRLAGVGGDGEAIEQHFLVIGVIRRPHGHRLVVGAARSEERRVGKECRSLWSTVS